MLRFSIYHNAPFWYPAIPNLFAIQTLDSAKKATTLNKALPTSRTDPLNVFIQINTSGEDSKSGLPLISSSTGIAADIEASELVKLARHIVDHCDRLHLRGLMTIGSVEQSTRSDDGPNKDFLALCKTAKLLEDTLSRSSSKGNNGNQGSTSPRWGIDGGKLELSMGMSADFESAIRAGAGTVRVGTGIFGARKLKQPTSTTTTPTLTASQ